MASGGSDHKKPAGGVSYKDEAEKIGDFLAGFYYEDEEDMGRKVFTYSEQIEQLALREQVAIYLDLEHLQQSNPDMVKAIEGNARRYSEIVATAVDGHIHKYLQERNLSVPVKDSLDAFIYQRLEMGRQQQERGEAELPGATPAARAQYPPALMRRFEVYFKHSGAKPMSVRDIKATHIGKLVTVRGIVIRATEVKPQAEVITYTCDTCANETYQPVTGPSFMPALDCPSRDCTESRANGRLIMQVRGSKFVKFQELRIQEHSDQVPVGSIPRVMTVYVKGENSRQSAPGDHLVLTGVFLPQIKQGFRQQFAGLLSDVFIEAHHIENVNQNADPSAALESAEELTAEEQQVVANPNFYNHLAYSIAPEIFGHDDIKKSLLLQLVGGVDKNASGMKIRGAINVCLMGDPGVAKSQLLSHIDRVATRCQYTTGRGSSGVGLTAAVMRDSVTGEMTLEGGALVLADRGICCIDEFDKMAEADRTAIHEVMEQQTISIAKAGIITTLNARVSILAAANPAFGRYNPKKSIEHNIQLPAALLSRFDLLWLIQDKPDADKDLRIAQHITYVHSHLKEPTKEGMNPLDMKLIRKYLALCKRKNPTVPEEMTERLVEKYVQLRREARNAADSTFTSPRILLACLRLATARCRLRLADVVGAEDVDEAFYLMETSKSSLRPEQDRKRRADRPIDVLYSAIRGVYQSRDPNAPDANVVSMNDARRCAAGKGISDADFEQCMEAYEAAGVWMFNDDRTRIIFAN